MTRGLRRTAALAAASSMVLAGTGVGVASAKMITLPNTVKSAAIQREAHANQQGIYPKAPPCPENGLLSGLTAGISVAGTGVPVANCGISEAPATTLPFLGDMAYWGGKVQTQPREYIVYWGWGEQGAFTSSTLTQYQNVKCAPESFSEGSIAVTLGCDPERSGKYIADFVNQIGGTQWANVQDQYFQTDSSGKPQYIDEHGNLLAGVWVDDADPADLGPTSATAAASSPDTPTSKHPQAAQPSGNTYTDMAAEAARAVAHFHLTPAQLIDSNIIIAQPPAFSDPNALNQGYCAFHDYTLSAAPGNTYYNNPAVKQGVVYTNLPYENAIQIGGSNVCGQYSVNGTTNGVNDDFSIALGHEIEEAATDPGAEDIVGNVTTGSQTYYGGWYDIADANENGDKCAYVGTPVNGIVGAPQLPGEPNVFPVPGAIGDITGSGGEQFAVQSLWSNASAGGAGYCAGIAKTDLPGSLAGEPPYSSETLLGVAQKGESSGRAAKEKAAAKQKRAARKHAAKRHAAKRHAAKRHTAKRHAVRHASKRA